MRLKDCSFCKKASQVQMLMHDDAMIRCVNCGQFVRRTDRQEAIDDWNDLQSGYHGSVRKPFRVIYGGKEP